MPLAPTPLSQLPTNVNGSSNRKAAPAKQAGSVTPAKWPLLGGGVYLKLAKAGKVDASDKELATLSPTLVRLAHARNKLFQALQAFDAAMRETRTDGPTPAPAVYNQLRRLRGGIEGAVTGFPLEVR